ncbi:hypothetical protein EFP84_05055 [Leptospira kmetyi]|uniref:Uncharacterized protein n=1 Tax=Leptospira kmetyi TaxID=408139 RepID=A0AAD0URN4_9LEPT|nr:hypothetical protein EFP84_05055 [Leptospira kmetyi]
MSYLNPNQEPLLLKKSSREFYVITRILTFFVENNKLKQEWRVYIRFAILNRSANRARKRKAAKKIDSNGTTSKINIHIFKYTK